MEEPMVASLTERLKEKYLEEKEDEGTDVSIQSFVSGSPIMTASRGALSLVVLNHTNIGYCGEISQYSNTLRYIREIDLAWNRLGSWNEVGTLLKHFPTLNTLNLSHNPLEAQLDEDVLPRCPQIKSLVLNGTDLPLPTLRRCLSQMPSLKELHLSDNFFDRCYFDSHANQALSSLPEEENKENAPISESVKTLHLNRCRISRWSDALSFLCSFPSIEVAFLCDNPIQVIGGCSKSSVDDCNPCTSNSESYANQIRTLNISKTAISDWKSIEALQSWPQLVDLRINNIPLMEGFSDEERLHLVVARIDNLKLLNGSHISMEQRETAERFFIRYYEEKEQKPEKYSKLLEKHGKLEKLAKVDLSPKTHAKVKIVCEEKNFSSTVNLRLSGTVSHLMRSLEKATAIPYAKMRLFYWDPADMAASGVLGPSELRFPSMPLYSFHVEDGGLFRVQSKLIPNRKRTQTKDAS